MVDAARFDREALAAALAGSCKVDAELVEELHRLTISYSENWDRLSPGMLLPVVDQHLRGLRLLLAMSQPGSERDLQEVAAETALTAGLLAWFLQQPALVESYVSIGSGYALLAGTGNLHSLALTLRADLCSPVQSDVTGRSDESVQLLLGAERAASRHATERAWALLRLAEEHAVLGEAGRTYQYLDEADGLGARSQPGILHKWSWRLHLAFRGNCERLLGHTEEAIKLLVQVLDNFPEDELPNRVASLIDLSPAYGELGDIDVACSKLSQALDLCVQRGGLQSRVKQAARVRNELLSKWSRHPAFRALDERHGVILRSSRAIV